MTFKPGDVVMLTSGGKAMTVLSAADGEVTCLWMTDAGQLHRESIPAIALEPIFGDDEDLGDFAADDDQDDDEEDEEEEEEEEEEDEHEVAKRGRPKR